MKNLFLGLALAIAAISPSHAQMVGTIGIGDVSYSAPNHNQSLGSKTSILNTLNSQIQTALINTRKFSVLDNTELTNLLEQRMLTLESFDTSVPHSDVFLQAGLDYILTADIVNLNVNTQQRGSNNASTGLMQINLFLQGVAHSTKDVKQEVTTQVPLQLDNAESSSATQKLVNAGVEQAVNQIITQLFPIRVIQIYEDEHIKLNYGNGVLSVGDTVHLHTESEAGKVFEPLRERLDPTKIVLEIVSVDQRFAIARALGNFNSVENLMVGKLQFN